MIVSILTVTLAMVAPAESVSVGAPAVADQVNWLSRLPSTPQEWSLLVLAVVCLLSACGFIAWGAWFVFAWMHEHLLDIQVRIRGKRLAIATDDASLADIARNRQQRDQIHRAELEKIRSMMSDINAKVSAGFTMGPEIEARIQRLHDENARLTEEVTVTASTTATSTRASAQLVKDLVDELREMMSALQLSMQSLPAETARAVTAAIGPSPQPPEPDLPGLFDRHSSAQSLAMGQMNTVLTRMTSQLEPLSRLAELDAGQARLHESLRTLHGRLDSLAGASVHVAPAQVAEPVPAVSGAASTLEEVRSTIREQPPTGVVHAGADPSDY